MAQKRKIPNQSGENVYIVSLIGGILGIAISVLLILLSPLILIKTNNPNSLSAITAWICLFIGGFVSAFLAATRLGNEAVKSGLLVGASMILMILPISFFVRGDFNVIGALITLLVIMLSAFLGGFAVYRLNTDQKRNMKKAMKRR